MTEWQLNSDRRAHTNNWIIYQFQAKFDKKGMTILNSCNKTYAFLTLI